MRIIDNLARMARTVLLERAEEIDKATARSVAARLEGR
jgi:hypothetical protein